MSDRLINGMIKMNTTPKPIWIKANNYNGFNVGQLIEHLKTLPKNKRVMINTSDNDCPLNIIQDSHEQRNSILLNNFYEEEFKK
tara:strand:- start:528 stop:779 length:252 start_codon:yes stop_codon:yes gene_type:complete